MITSVERLMNPLMTKPARMHLISEIPDPAAYGAQLLTKKAHTNANSACEAKDIFSSSSRCHLERKVKYCESDVEDPLNSDERRPLLPVLAPARIVQLAHLPAAELAVQPPTLRAVPELEVRKPDGNDGHDGGVETDSSACVRSRD